MATKSQRMSVGIFVLIGAAIIVAGVMYMEGFRSSPQTPYLLEFDYSILGLNVGAMVEYNGVPVGQVTRISVTDHNTAQVEIICNDDVVSLHEGVTATATLQSFVTGVLLISLKGGDPEKPRLAPHYQIPTESSLTAELLTGVTNLQDNITRIASGLSDSLEGIKKGDLTRIVQNVESITEEALVAMDGVQDIIEDTRGTVSTVSERAEGAIEKFENLADSFQETSENVNGLVTDIREKVAEIDVDARQEELAKVLNTAEEAAASITKLTDSLNKTVEGTQFEVDNMEYMLRDVLRSVTATLESVRALTEELREDPSALIRGRAQQD